MVRGCKYEHRRGHKYVGNHWSILLTSVHLIGKLLQRKHIFYNAMWFRERINNGKKQAAS